MDKQGDISRMCVPWFKAKVEMKKSFSEGAGILLIVLLILPNITRFSQ